MIIKNYKELCELLEIKISNGNTKIKQLKELELYCKYEKQGNKFIVKSIYEKPLAKKTTGKYIDLIGDILINYLYKHCKDTGYNITLTIGNIMEIVGLVNTNYTVGNRHKQELSEILKVNPVAVYYFYNNTRGEFKKIIERALNSLHNRRVLTYNKVRTIYIHNTTNDTKYYKDATKEEDRYITNIEKEVIESMGYKKLNEVFINCKMNEFQKRVNKKLPRNDKYNKDIVEEWIYYFYAYNLNIGDIAIQIEYDNIKQKKKELNDKSINKTKKSLKADENEIQLYLIDTLIDIIKYDLEISDKVIDLYIDNKKEREKRIHRKEREILKIHDEVYDVGFESIDYMNYKNIIKYNLKD